MMKSRKIKRGKYFSHILVSYLGFALIALISAITIYQMAYQRMIDQRTEADYAVFEQFYNIVDQELKNATNKVSELQKDYNTLVLLDEEYPDKISPYSIYQVAKKLRMVSNNNLSDLFIYLPNSDKIVSGYKGTLSAKYYFETYYSAGLYSTELITISTAYELLPMTNRVNQNTIAIKMPIFSSSYTYPVICVVNPDNINERMKSLEQSTGGNIMILNSDNQVLLRSDSLTEVDPSDLTLNEGVEQMTIDGRKYVVFVKASSLVACKYVSFVPLDTMHQSLSFFQLYSVINMLTLFLFGILLAFLLTKVNYKPVVQLMESATLLNDKNQFLTAGTEEFKYIEASMQNAITEKTKYLSELSELRQARKYNLMFNLINGIVPTGSSAENLFAEIGKELISERFAVMIYDIEEWNDEVFSRDFIEERPMLSKIILPNVIEELCDENNRGYIINIHPNQFVCIVNLADGTDIEALASIAERALNFLNDQMGILCTAGIGNLCSSLKEIRSSYNEARRAGEYKIIFGTGQVLCYHNFFALTGAYDFTADSSVPITLLKGIKDDAVDCGKLFNDIYTRCFNGTQPGTPEIARSFIFNLCVQTNEILNELDDQNDVSLSDHRFDLNIETYKTIDGFREYFIRRMEDIRKEYHEHHSIKSLGESIREFIEEHYADFNLGVNEIGSQFNLSPAYCSKIFKQETNQSIPECISAVRVNRACEKLVETAEPLDTIAQNCGFTSSAVFIRSFKKICGVTPGNYRKIMKK